MYNTYVAVDNSMSTISLCMIVKDEETAISRAIGSVMNSVDEIVVVDTGSEDRTVDVLQEFGAKVYHHPWKDDFSKHRNQSIGYAVSDWILILDADEEVTPESLPSIEKAVRDGEIDSVMVETVSFTNQASSRVVHNQIRLFRNNGKIRYEGIVHNQLIGYERPKKYPVTIRHYGYDLEPVVQEKKHKRTERLLKKQIKKKPGNYVHHLNLAVLYATKLDFRRSIQEALTATTLADREGVRDDNLLWTYYIASFGYFNLGDMARAEHYTNRALNLHCGHVDSYFVRVLIYHKERNWRKLEKSCFDYMSALNAFNRPSVDAGVWTIVNTANEKWRVHLALGDVFLNRGDTVGAETQFEEAVSLTPRAGECLRIIGDCYRSRENWPTARRYYEQAVKENRHDSEAVFGLAMVNRYLGDEKRSLALIRQISDVPAERWDIAFEVGTMALRDKRYEEAASRLMQTIKYRPRLYSAYVNAALAYKALGRYEKAVDLNQRAVDLDPGGVEARCNLATLYLDMGNYALACEACNEALTVAPSLLDVRIGLSHAYLRLGDGESFYVECTRIMRELRIVPTGSVNNMDDLADVFLTIGSASRDAGSRKAAARAESIAAELSPERMAQAAPMAGDA